MTFTDIILENPEIVSAVIFLLFAIPASIIDARTKKIPDPLNLFGIVILLCYRFSVDKKEALVYIMSAIMAFLLLLTVRLATKKGLGLGDAKYGALCASYAGPIAVFVGFILAAIFAGIFYAFKRKSPSYKKDQAFSFAPFLSAGTFISSLPSLILYFMKLKG